MASCTAVLQAQHFRQTDGQTFVQQLLDPHAQMDRHTSRQTTILLHCDTCCCTAQRSLPSSRASRPLQAVARLATQSSQCGGNDLEFNVFERNVYYIVQEHDRAASVHQHQLQQHLAESAELGRALKAAHQQHQVGACIAHQSQEGYAGHVCRSVWVSVIDSQAIQVPP